MNEEQKQTALLEGEIATRTHMKDVSDALMGCAAEILIRARDHDLSKLEDVEHEKFSLAASRFKEAGNEFGSEGYEKTKEWLGSALEHHYENNSHHPEHYDNGIGGMNLFDVLEMLIDWRCASMRRSDEGVIDFDIMFEKYECSDELQEIIKKTAEYLDFEYK